MRTFVTTARRALSVAAVAVILAGCTRAPQQQYEGIATDEPSVVPSATATNYSSPSMKPAPVATPTMKPVAPPAAADQEKVDAATGAFLDTLHVCDDPAAAAEVLRSLYKGPATEAFLREKVQKLQALRGCAQPPPSAAVAMRGSGRRSDAHSALCAPMELGGGVDLRGIRCLQRLKQTGAAAVRSQKLPHTA